MQKITRLSNSSIKENIVDIGKNLIFCLEALEKSNNKFLVVTQDKIVKGVLTDGDIRRYLFKTSNLNTNIKNVMNKNFKFISESSNIKSARSRMANEDIDFILIIDNKSILKGAYLLEDKNTNVISNACLIQAGGYGKRLGELTKNKPKALVEINGRTLIEIQIEKLYEQGFRNIFISVHHLKKKIINYIDKNIKYTDLNMNFIIEQKPLGTFGSVISMKNEREPFLVKNCDVLTEVDYKDFMKSFDKKKTLLRVGLTNYEIQIPFGVASLGNKDSITFIEKPVKNYYINTGIYLVNPFLIKPIRKNVRLDFDEFTKKHSKLGKVESKLIMSHWFDIGTQNNLESAREFYSKK